MSEREALSRLIFDNQEEMRSWEEPSRAQDLAAEFSLLKSLLAPSITSLQISESLSQVNVLPLFKLISYLVKSQRRDSLKVGESFAMALQSADSAVEYHSNLICYYSFKRTLTSVPGWLRALASRKLSEPMNGADEQTASHFLYGLLAVRVSKVDRDLETSAIQMLFEADDVNTQHLAFQAALLYISKVTKLYPEVFPNRDDFRPVLERLVQKRCIHNLKTMKRVVKLCSNYAALEQVTIEALADQMKELCVRVKNKYILNVFGREPRAAEWYAEYLYNSDEVKESLHFVYEYNRQKSPASFTEELDHFCKTLQPRSIVECRDEMLDIAKAQVYGSYLNETFLDNLFKYASNEVTDFNLAKELIPLQILFIQHMSSSAEEQLNVLDQFVVHLIGLLHIEEPFLFKKTGKMIDILTLICKLLPEKSLRIQNIIVESVTDPDLLTIKKCLLSSTSSPLVINAVPEIMLTTIDHFVSLLADESDIQERVIAFTEFAENYLEQGSFDYKCISVEESKNPDIYVKEFISLILYRAIGNLTAEEQPVVSKKRVYRVFLKQLKTSVLLDLLYGETDFQVKLWIVSCLSNLFSYQITTREFQSFQQVLYVGAIALACSPFPPLEDKQIRDLVPFVTSRCFKAALRLVVPEKDPTNEDLVGYLHQVYYANLPDHLASITLFRGTTLLNIDQREDDNLSLGKRIVTVLHELAHKVRKMKDGKYNFVERTIETEGIVDSGVPGKKEETKNSLREGGILLENYLFGSSASFVNSEQLRYIITIDNWQQPLDEFNKAIKKLSEIPSSAVYVFARSQSDIFDLQRPEPTDSLHWVKS